MLEFWMALVAGLNHPSLIGQVLDVGNDPGKDGSVRFQGGIGFYNNTGGTLAAGCPVYLSGYHASGVRVTKADADAAGSDVMYFVAESTPDATRGVLVSAGKIQVSGLDCTGATLGDPVYLTTTAGVVSLTGTVGVNPVVGRVAELTSPGFVYFNTVFTQGGSTGSQDLWPDGTAALPGLGKQSDTDTGFYGFAANSFAVSLGGVGKLALSGSAPSFAAATDTAGTDIYLTAISAGASATAARTGGGMYLTGGAGSAGSAAINGGAGGPTGSTAGAGGAKTGTGTANGGNGGDNTHTGGVGGATASTNAGSVGGTGGGFYGRGATGGACSAGTGNGGPGGPGVVQGGDGGTSAGGVGGAGGKGRVVAGAPGASGNVNGSAVELAPSAGQGTGSAGIVYVSLATTPVAQTGAATQAAATVANAGTLTAAQHRGQQVYQDASGGNVTMTTLTGTLLAAALPDLPTGGFIFLFCASNHAANTSTLSGGTDVTLVGSGALTQTGATFILRKTAATTFDLVRVG